MGRGTFEYERDFGKLIKKGYSYLLDNFHKFSQPAKIHISLEIIKKAMPKEVNLKGEIDTTVKVTTIDIKERQKLIESRISQECMN